MATVVTQSVTVTGSQSVVVVTSTIGASELSLITGSSTATATATAAASSSADSSSPTSSSSSSLSGAAASNTSSPSSLNTSRPIGGIIGGVVGGIALIALLIVLALMRRKRSQAKKKAANPFPDDENEKGPAVIAGLPPKPTTPPRPASRNFSMADANSSMALLGTETDSRSAQTRRPSTTSLAMGSAASYPHSHASHFGSPMTQDPAAFAGYPDVNRTAFYEPAPAGSAAAAYNYGNAGASVSPRSSVYMGDAPAQLPIGAAAPDYAAASEVARTRRLSRGYQGEPTQSGATSPTGSHSRRASWVESDSLQQRRLSAGAFSCYQPNLHTIPGSVAASEVASDHHSMHSSALGNRVAQQHPTIAAGSSPPLSQGAVAGDSDGYNTYTGAVKGQLRVVGPSGAYGQPTIAEEDPRFSTSSRTGSRMLEMLDAEEQPIVLDSVTGGEPTQPTATLSRPPFWKERSRSAQSITRVFRSSPRQSAATELPPLDLPRSELAPEAPTVDGEANMWKEPSRAKSPSALRKWTTRRNSKGPQGGADNEVDVDQLFSS